jgi:predicted transcriptional regulator
MDERLNDLIEKAETWPEEARERLFHAAEVIERSLPEVYVLSSEELQSIEEGLEDIRNGRIASDVEMETLFAQCRSN